MPHSVTESADVCVVGTGAGGGVVAKELAEAGAKVVMLERGGSAPKLSHGESMSDGALRVLSETRALRTALAFGLPPMPIIYGRCVGGSAALNAGTCFRIPEPIHRKWTDDLHLEAFHPLHMEKLYRNVETFLNIREVEPHVMGSSGRVFRRGIEALGFAGGVVKRNAKGCKGAGACVIGCPNDAKLSPNISWVPRAVEKGAVLKTHCKVERVEASNGRATGVEAVWKPDGPKGEAVRLKVEAPVVVLAAGAIDTPAILWKSRIPEPSGQMGRNFRIHPGVAAGAIFDEEIYCWRGVPQSYYSDHFIEEGMIFLVGAVPPMIGSLVVPGFGLEHKEWMSRYTGFTDGGGLISDSQTGRIRPGPGGMPVLSYQLGRRDAQRLIRALEITCRIYLAAGAKTVFPGFLGAKAVRNEGELRDQLDSFGRDFPRRRLIGGSLHPMGTCRMGVSPDDSVVNPNGEMHSVPGLFIADGGILPTSTVVNPQQTIMTLATHVAWHIRDGSTAS